MSGETARQESGWTVDTLKEYLESRIDGNDKRYAQRFDAQEAASKYVQTNQNEFRGALQDVGEKQMPRTEAEAEFKSIRGSFVELKARMDRDEGRGGGLNSSWGYLIGAVALVASLIAIFMALRKG